MAEKHESETLPRYPEITFPEAEVKDLTLRAELTAYRDKFVPLWKKEELPVLRAFEEVREVVWPDNLGTHGLQTRFTKKYPSRYIPPDEPYRGKPPTGTYGQIFLRTREFLLGTVADHVHELAHAFVARQGDYQYLKATFGHLVDTSWVNQTGLSAEAAENSVVAHLLIQPLWEEVMRRCFAEAYVAGEIQRARRLAPPYVEAYRILDSLSAVDKQRIIRRRYR
jgi:hypothetical protein